MCRPFPFPPTNMRSKALAILSAPIACWALYGCLVLADVDGDVAGVAAVLWGVFWLVLLQFGREADYGNSRGIVRDGPIAHRPRGRSVRANFTHAILASLCLPIPVYLLAVVLDAAGLMPATVSLPLFAIMGASAPLSVWWMVIRPEPKRDKHIIVLGAWHAVESAAPTGVIPPRNSSARLAS